jgi:hypothetical protein
MGRNINACISRSTGKPTTMSKSLNPLFDTLWIAAGDTYIRQPKGVPHCDCHKSNEAYFGRPVPINTHRGGVDANYQTVPTKATKGLCDFCGHVAPLIQPSVVEKKGRGYNPKQIGRTKQVNDGVYKVRGTNVVTGEAVEFACAEHARKAGYLTVIHSLRENKVVKNWKWERVGATNTTKGVIDG